MTIRYAITGFDMVSKVENIMVHGTDEQVKKIASCILKHYAKRYIHHMEDEEIPEDFRGSYHKFGYSGKIVFSDGFIVDESSNDYKELQNSLISMHVIN